MRKSIVPIIAVALIAVGLLGLGATTVYLQVAAPSAMPPGGSMDAMFIEQMIPHHDDAIEMAELALEEAEHPEIKQLARDIKRTQTAENAQMRKMYRDWYDAEVPDAGSFGMMGGMMRSGASDMAYLKAADDFDKAFIEAMVPHHEMGIMMSRMAGSATNRSDLRQLTSAIIEGQSVEIAKMQAWYEEWYGR